MSFPSQEHSDERISGSLRRNNDLCDFLLKPNNVFVDDKGLGKTGDPQQTHFISSYTMLFQYKEDYETEDRGQKAHYNHQRPENVFVRF